MISILLASLAALVIPGAVAYHRTSLEQRGLLVSGPFGFLNSFRSSGAFSESWSHHVQVPVRIIVCSGSRAYIGGLSDCVATASGQDETATIVESLPGYDLLHVRHLVSIPRSRKG